MVPDAEAVTNGAGRSPAWSSLLGLQVESEDITGVTWTNDPARCGKLAKIARVAALLYIFFVGEGALIAMGVGKWRQRSRGALARLVL